MTKTNKLKRCLRCEQNFYNGNNELGIKECWHLGSAKLELRKEVPISQVPPWNQPPRKFLSCYRQKGYVYVESDATC